jgi:hypothetical protein
MTDQDPGRAVRPNRFPDAAWPWVRSTMATARSNPIRDGRQMYSSTPKVFTPATGSC